MAVEGGTTLRALLRGFPWDYLVELLPAGTLDEKVWVSLKGTIRTGAGRAEVDLTDFALGKQTLHPFLLRWAVGSAGRELLSVSLPKSVEHIEVEEGRAVISTRSR